MVAPRVQVVIVVFGGFAALAALVALVAGELAERTLHVAAAAAPRMPGTFA